MQVRILKPLAGPDNKGGGDYMLAGDIAEIEDGIAADLIRDGFAAEIDVPKPVKVKDDKPLI